MTEKDAVPAAEMPARADSAVLHRLELSLPCHLNNDELLAFGEQLANALGEITAIESSHEAQKKQMKADLADAEASVATLRKIVATKSVHRSVECVDIADYVSGRWKRVRQDTGEVVAERRLTEDEVQLPMTGVIAS